MTDISNRTKHIQLLRNSEAKNSIEDFIGAGGLWKNPEFINQLKDGEQILGRYKSGDVFHTLYGIAHIFSSNNGTSYIEVFQNEADAKKYGNGIQVNKGKVESRLTENGGLIFNQDATDGEKGIEVQAGENIAVNASGVNVVRDNESIVTGTDKALTVGKIECGDWA